MDYFENLYPLPPPPPKPHPEGFRMPNRFYLKGGLEEAIALDRYYKLTNQPRFINERRHFPVTDLLNEGRRW